MDLNTLATHERERLLYQKTSQNLKDLEIFLQTCSVTGKGSPSTNLMDSSRKKTWNLNSSQWKKFFTMYEACRIERNQHVESPTMLHLSERQYSESVEYSGIMLDFDRIQKSPEREFTAMHIRTVVRKFAQLLQKSCVIENSQEFNVFVAMKIKPLITENGDYKDGFHVLIPQVCLNKPAKKYLLGLFNPIAEEIFKTLGANPFDQNSGHVPVHFYGSGKPGKIPYRLTHHYTITLYGTDEVELRINDIVDGNLAVDNMSLELSLTIPSTTFPKSQYYLLPDLDNSAKILADRSENAEEDDLYDTDGNLSILMNTDINAREMSQFLSLLDNSYVEDYDKWFKVLTAIAQTSQMYKPIARAFSQRSPSYSPASFEKFWNDACNLQGVETPLTYRSIKYWAHKCQPEQCEQLSANTCLNRLLHMAYESAGTINHAGVAELLHYQFGNKFVCDYDPNLISRTGANINWYEFVLPGDKHTPGQVYKWRQEDQPVSLQRFIVSKFPIVYREAMDIIRQRIKEEQDQNIQKWLGGVCKKLQTSMNNLGMHGYQTGVLMQARHYFHHRGFIASIDSYPFILGVGNGVLKLGKNPQLIQGFHEFHTISHTPVEYVPYDENNPNIKILMDGFRKIFDNPSTFEFIMCHASTMLDKRVIDAIFLILHGGGANGKTTLYNFIMETLGPDIIIAGKSGLLTSPMEMSNSANSAQVHSKDKRGVIYDEFNDTDALNAARIKQVANPSQQSGRDLNKRQENFTNTATPVALTNHRLKINSNDHGMWRRVYYLEMNKVFKENPNPNNKNELLMDPKFARDYPRMYEMKVAMLSILVYFYSILWTKYNGDLFAIPVPEIREHTENYRNAEDAVNRFITWRVVCSPESHDIPIRAMANYYIEWYRQEHPHQAKPAIDVCINQLANSRLKDCFVVPENSKDDTRESKVLRGYRILENAKDMPRAGETFVQGTLATIKPHIIKKQAEELHKNIIANINMEDNILENIENLINA